MEIMQTGEQADKRKKKRRRNAALLLASCALLTAAGAYRTYSFFTGKEEVTNVFTVGDFDISLQEPDWEPDNGDGENVCPGYSVYKNPTVKNVTRADKGAQPCYLQVRMQICDEDGTRITDEERLALILETIRYDSTYTGSWEKSGTAEKLTEGRVPGYSLEEMKELPMVNPVFEETQTGQAGEYLFRYVGGEDGILQIGEEATLFTTIAIPTEWKSAQIEKVGKYRLVIGAEAIQASGFASAKEAFAMLQENLKEEDQSAETTESAQKMSEQTEGGTTHEET